MNGHSKKSAFEPSELATLQDIFKEITTQDWFPNSAEAREGFAKFLFDTFPEGSFNSERHRSGIEASARMFYAVDQVH
jgi:hypothetical protein